MNPRILSSACLLMIISHATPHAALGAERLTWPIESSTYDCSRPSIVTNEPLFSVTAWEEEGIGVRTEFQGIACTGSAGLTVPRRHDHGPGEGPTIGWLLDGTYILAFERGDSLVVREGDGDALWETVAVVYLGDAADVVGRIDLWCSPYWPYREWAWLALWSGSRAGGGVRFMRRIGPAWTALETVPTPGSESLDFSFPQVTDADGPFGPQPRIYYIDPEFGPCLKSVDLVLDSGWTEPVSHACDFAFGSEFDVARTVDGYVFLTLGLQPTCPCNFIHFCEWTAIGGWGVPVDMTEAVNEFDWPMSPQVAVDDGGRVHVFWHQLGSDPTLEPHSKRLYYWIRDGGVWEDHSDGLADQQDVGLDGHVSLSLDQWGEAALAWARRDTVESVPQPQRIWTSYFNYCALEVDAGPAAVMQVTAVPNPFNPAVKITATSGQAIVAVELYDALGRRVTTLPTSVVAGAWQACWRGRDDEGRMSPSGVYVARVRDATGATASCKIMLAR